MKSKTRFLNAQFLFPTIIIGFAVCVLSIALFRSGGKTFIAEQTENSGFASASWMTLTEEEFYQNMSVAMRVEFKYPPTYYNLTTPESDVTLPIAVYEAWAGDIIAQPRYLPTIQAGEIYKIHSLPSSFTDREVKPENDSFLLFLFDQRDKENFVPDPEFAATYYADYFEQFGYSVITPSCSIFLTEGYQVKTESLPEYLQGKGEYTNFDELCEIVAAGRQKYGIPAN